MKNKMPLDGLGLGHDSGSVHCDMLKMLCFRTAWGVYVSGIKKVSEFQMYACCWPGCLSVMYDADKIGLVQIKDVRKNNDTAMWLKVVQKAPCYLLKENLARYRRRAVSITPKPLWKRIWAHYPLFRVAEEMNPIRATFWVVMNVFGNAYKKMFYVKKYETTV